MTNKPDHDLYLAGRAAHKKHIDAGSEWLGGGGVKNPLEWIGGK